MLEHLGSIQLAGEKRELTILISDVRNFTTMSEKADPLELIALLDEYLAAMTDIIFRYDGIVDKFIGDGILPTGARSRLATTPMERPVRHWR